MWITVSRFAKETKKTLFSAAENENEQPDLLKAEVGCVFLSSSLV